MTPSDQPLVNLVTSDALLPADLSVPAGARALVVFVHGSGSSRLSPRNRQVAEYLNRRGLATLLFDLLTEQEHSVDTITAEFRFDIGRLTRRVCEVIDWLGIDSELRHLRLGLFGASTGAAAALRAAAEQPAAVGAIVLRGGRSDLAADALVRVQAPTLQIVGSEDLQVLQLNRQAGAQMQCEQRLSVIPGATHLFEEPGALEQVARLAGDWFTEHLGAAD